MSGKDCLYDPQHSCLTGTPLGNDYFRAMIEQKLRRKVGQASELDPVKGSDRVVRLTASFELHQNIPDLFMIVYFEK